LGSISAPFLILIIHSKTFHFSTPKLTGASPQSLETITHQIVNKNIQVQTGKHYQRGNAAVPEIRVGKICDCSETGISGSGKTPQVHRRGV